MSSVLKVMWWRPSPCFSRKRDRKPSPSGSSSSTLPPFGNSTWTQRQSPPAVAAHQVLAAERVAVKAQRVLDRVDGDGDVVELEAGGLGGHLAGLP